MLLISGLLTMLLAGDAAVSPEGRMLKISILTIARVQVVEPMFGHGTWPVTTRQLTLQDNVVSLQASEGSCSGKDPDKNGSKQRPIIKSFIRLVRAYARAPKKTKPQLSVCNGLE